MRPLALECETLTSPPSTGSASASSSSGVYPRWRPSSLAAGLANSAASPGRGIAAFMSQVIAWKTSSAARPSGYSSAIPMPGIASRSASAAATRTSGWISMRAATVSVRMSYSSAPLEQIAVPRWPNIAAIGGITRGGRPVTSTNRAPAASTRANAAIVRAEIVPSPRMMVPSRSVATSRGKDRTGYEPNLTSRPLYPLSTSDTCCQNGIWPTIYPRNGTSSPRFRSVNLRRIDESTGHVGMLSSS